MAVVPLPVATFKEYLLSGKHAESRKCIHFFSIKTGNVAVILMPVNTITIIIPACRHVKMGWDIIPVCIQPIPFAYQC